MNTIINRSRIALVILSISVVVFSVLVMAPSYNSQLGISFSSSVAHALGGDSGCCGTGGFFGGGEGNPPVTPPAPSCTVTSAP